MYPLSARLHTGAGGKPRVNLVHHRSQSTLQSSISLILSLKVKRRLSRGRKA